MSQAILPHFHVPGPEKSIKRPKFPTAVASKMMMQQPHTTRPSVMAQQQQQYGSHQPAFPGPSPPTDSFSSSSAGSTSPSLSLRTATAEDSLSTLGERAGVENGTTELAQINLQIFVPELQMQKCFSVPLDELVWDIKRRLLESLPQPLVQSFNFGLFLPPCDGRAGKFLLEDRPIRDYPFHDCVPYVELKYKKRVYKMLRLDEKALRAVHSKSNLRKMAEAIQQRNAQKVERLCTQGLDPNFHDAHGETPLTLASGIPGSREVLVQLVGGGAHLDFRNTEGQTGMHKASFLSAADNVRALLELGASPNYRDLLGLTPLYYNMLSTDSNPEVAEMLLAEAADLDVVDMHGNTALHQACKNGLSKHAEQLLFYGADINARNVNGNTALHVCAVNGRVDCAQVLLYRGADPTLTNRQGQTALQVAHIVGSMPVADVIHGHSPNNIVPFREPPKLNPRRRLSSRQFSMGQDGQSIRRRSLSHCSSSSTIASSSQRYSNVQHQHHGQTNSPSPSITSSMADYGTLKRIPAEAVQQQQPGFEANTPRILVIPRGPKGFGFILRGARHVESMQLEFRPTPAVPALQFFEGVDMQGMAMRAGLRPGDFLLEINGVDVRAASHEQVVQLIHQSGDTITLKVITVDLEALSHDQQQIYGTGSLAGAPGCVTYATIGRRNHSVPRTATTVSNGPPTNGQMPPAPPQRNPSTTLSFGRAFAANGGAAQFSTADLPPAHPNNNALSTQQPTQHHQQLPLRHPSGGGTASSPSDSQQIRCASVKLNRSSAVRRISAAELEHLMVQQGSSQQQQSILLGPEQPNGGNGMAPKKFTSVTEMKRRKQSTRTNSISDDPNAIYGQSALKNSTSSPDLPGGTNRPQSDPSGAQGTPTQSSAFRPLLRPKTPPPPPPPPPAASQQRQAQIVEPPEPPQQPIYASTVVVQQTVPSTSAAPPPPPPPPPPNLLLRPSQPMASTSAQPKPQDHAPKPKKEAPAPNTADCRGVSAEALRSVRLKPVTSRDEPEQKQAATNAPKSTEKPGPGKFAPPANFDLDLRSALARRRSKVRGVEEGSESGNEMEAGAANKEATKSAKMVSIVIGQEKAEPVAALAPSGTTTVGRYNGGLSLRESVLENVSGAAGKPGQSGCPHKTAANSHSPPGGFIGNKKDSGYTSSRTSLEPSECGDCCEHGQQHVPTATNAHASLPVQHRVTMLSQQLMDQQAIAQQTPLAKTALKSRLPSPRFLDQNPLVRIPPIDYDLSEGSQTSTDSGNQTDLDPAGSSQSSVDQEPQMSMDEETPTDSQQPSSSSTPTAHNEQRLAPQQRTGQFRQKPIAQWAPEDVSEWLEALELTDHSAAFAAIKGPDLLLFDRARYTALGVTRVGDRQRMEQSLRAFQRE